MWDYCEFEILLESAWKPRMLSSPATRKIRYPDEMISYNAVFSLLRRRQRDSFIPMRKKTVDVGVQSLGSFNGWGGCA
ncbi:hypothetical protein MTR67_006727 [Solanum verrucosum]|uniref:Uncharacterized protein n=1 Tax=Solanum verrucosum TaxID=315347 RepID=A0AAF0T9Y8_SOLVR|nr:hypothetical protein MTR67_006727 [Solanum verrucosum]